MNRLKAALLSIRLLAVFCLIVFALGIGFGLVSYGLVKDQMVPIIKEAFGGVIVEGSDFKTIMNIFVRNVWASATLMVLGVLIVPTLLILFVNGFIVGIVGDYSLDKGISLVKLLMGILPHGIFEVPAILLSAAVGLKVGLNAIFPKGKSRVMAVAEGVRDATSVYLLVILPLILVAAFIEVLISKRLVS